MNKRKPEEVVRATKIPARRNGIYYINFKDKTVGLPSVTTILGNTIPKGQLMYWAQRETAKAIFANPAISMEEALAAPYQKSRKAMDRGSRIHSLAEAYFKTGEELNEDNVVEFDKGHFQAIKSFFDEEKPKCLFIEDFPMIEVTGFNLKYGYAGTIDFIGEHGDVYDWKTGKAVYKDNHYQQAAYMNFEYIILPNKKIIEAPKLKDSYIIHIRKDGGYAKIQCENLFNKFLTILTMYKEVINEGE